MNRGPENSDEYVPQCNKVTWSELSKELDNRLSVLNINMRSISNKFSEFCAYLKMVKSTFSFIVVTETWLKDSTDFLYEIDGYKSVSINRNDRKGGRIEIYHDESISVQILNEISGLSDTSERLLIKAFVPNIGSVILGAVYCPPASFGP